MSGLGNQLVEVDDSNFMKVVDENVEINRILPVNFIEVNAEKIVKSDDFVPVVGKEFASHEEAFEFYSHYGRKVGFPVRRRNSSKGRDEMITSVTFVCSREGKRISTARNALKPHPTMQTGCNAKMTACSNIEGKWRITVVNLEHNHNVSPLKSRLFRCNRQLTDQVKRKLEVNDIAGIPLHKSFNSTVVEAGGYEQLPFIEKDCINYIAQVQRLRLGEGDATAIQTYFSKMQASSPGFFFSIDLDEDCRLKNVFWAYNQCREAYKEFGDVVTFDTTYLTNKYDMPFAPFVGVNHHGQSTLFGCGLISGVDTKNFIWLFRTWLECMEGHSPRGIVTDQDSAMKNAIQTVFPEAKHHWCLWHILKKLAKKFGGHAQKEVILHAVHNVVYDSQFPEEFEHRWNLMIDLYSLHNNDWLSGLYMERGRWVPYFLRTNFWARMSTTQRSESMNAFFDDFIHSRTTLKQFVEQYERSLRAKVEKKFHADFQSYTKMLPCATKFTLEQQFQEVYTLSKFKEFQVELTNKVYCDIISTDEGFGGTTYLVQEVVILDNSEKSKIFTIFQKQSCDIICSCHLFEFKGIICRHDLAVLIRNNVKMFPQFYLLHRWRRDICKAYTRVKINYDGCASTIEQIRYDELSKKFAKVANQVVDDERRAQELMDLLDIILSDSGSFFPLYSETIPSDAILDPHYLK